MKVRYPARAETFHGLLGHLINPWAHWDGVWFIRIAANGYHHEHSAAFFPLYPAIVRAVSYGTGGSFEIAGIVVSLVCFATAMVVLYRMVGRLYDTRVAAIAVSLMALAPASFYFQAVYSESLFLLTTLLTISFALRGRWAAACLAGFLAALTRNAGILLVAPLLIIYWQEQGFSIRRLRLRLRDLRLGWLALVPAGIAVYMAFLAGTTGDPLGFMHAEQNWHRELGVPLVTAFKGTQVALSAVQPILFKPATWAFTALQPGSHFFGKFVEWAVPGLTLVLSILALVWGWRRLPLALTVFAALSLLVPLSFPAAERPLYSLARFAVVIFPLFIAAALWLRSRRVLLVVTSVLSTAALIWLTVGFAIFARVA